MGKSPIKDTYAWKSALTVSGGKAIARNDTCGKVRNKRFTVSREIQLQKIHMGEVISEKIR